MTPTRRSVIAASGGVAMFGLLPSWARSAAGARGIFPVTGPEFDLTIAHTPLAIDGRRTHAITVNGTLPGPLLRFRENERVTLRVTNLLDEDSSIHWHGLLVPFQMDGVPGVAFPGIKPGKTFVYDFSAPQSGTYWYHSHSGLQEQMGHYGPLIIDPEQSDPVAYDREVVLMLADWAFAHPHRLMARLKQDNEAFNVQQRTIADFIRDARLAGLVPAVADRAMWGRMRMSATDIADVTGAVYTYVVNGHSTADNFTALYQKGERVRLRIVNSSAMTIFNFRIIDAQDRVLPMIIVQSDGQNVAPVETDEFQIGVAETYDAIVRPQDGAYAIVAESIDRSGQVVATLAPTAGMRASAPALRERPLLTHKDMGMAHGAMGGMNHGAMPGVDHESMGHSAGMEHDAMQHDGRGMSDGGMQAHPHKKGAGVDNLVEQPTNRLAEPGLGLADVGHRTLSYADLKSLDPNPDAREPEREIEVHLTGNMERFMWSFDGVKFSDAKGPLFTVNEGERVRLVMVNDTMMTHPIHLHGQFFEVVNGEGDRKPRKHTIDVKPGEKMAVDFTANPGDWAFHCHLLLHMHGGMMQVVSVRRRESLPESERRPARDHYGRLLSAAQPPSPSGKDHDHGAHGQKPAEPKPQPKEEAPKHEHHDHMDHGGHR